MSVSKNGVYKVRKSFAKITEVMEVPNLIDVQLLSYGQFLQKDVPPEERKNIGLQEVFDSVFPFGDFKGTRGDVRGKWQV